MKNILSILFFIIFYSIIFAQPPQGINYQGVARNASGHPVLNQNINIRLSILDSSATGQAVYIETHAVTTNNSGLFNLSIGAGNIVSGVFANIPWGQGNKWLKTEMDTSGGSNYQLIGTTQFLSVPFALHSLSSTKSNYTNKVISRYGFPNSSNWTCPSGITQITVELWGGSGGGGGYSSNCSPLGGNGGKGGYNRQIINVTSGTIYSIIVGNGGLSGANGSCAGIVGSNGQSTIFGNNLLVAQGGQGGTAATSCCNGTNGADGTIINCPDLSSTNTPSLSRSYLPANFQFVTNPYSCFSNGGSGGSRGSNFNATSGENGLCILYY